MKMIAKLKMTLSTAYKNKDQTQNPHKQWGTGGPDPPPLEICGLRNSGTDLLKKQLDPLGPIAT